MRAAIIFISILIALALSTVVAPARVDQPGVSPRDLKSIAVEPLAKPRSGKNIALSLAVKSESKLPSGFAIGINNKPIDLVDNGAWPDAAARDGVYTVAAKSVDSEVIKEKKIQPLDIRSAHASPAISCDFKRVECPSSCKSVLFGSKCVVCFELTGCKIEF